MESWGKIKTCTIDFQCPKLWAMLAQTEDPNVRFCDQCFEKVHLIATEDEMVEHVKLGHCVAILNPQPEDCLLGKLVMDDPETDEPARD